MARSRTKANTALRTHRNQMLKAKKREFIALVVGLLGKKSGSALYFVKNFTVHAFLYGAPCKTTTHYTVRHILTRKIITVRTEDPIAVLNVIAKLLTNVEQERQRLQSLMERQKESEASLAEEVTQAIRAQKEPMHRKQKPTQIQRTHTPAGTHA